MNPQQQIAHLCYEDAARNRERQEAIIFDDQRKRLESLYQQSEGFAESGLRSDQAGCLHSQTKMNTSEPCISAASEPSREQLREIRHQTARRDSFARTALLALIEKTPLFLGGEVAPGKFDNREIKNIHSVLAVSAVDYADKTIAALDGPSDADAEIFRLRDLAQTRASALTSQEEVLKAQGDRIAYLERELREACDERDCAFTRPKTVTIPDCLEGQVLSCYRKEFVAMGVRLAGGRVS